MVVRTYGGPFAGDTREIEPRVLGVPPPVRLPGIFHGGSYMLRKQPGQGTVVEYDWVPMSPEFGLAGTR